MKRLAMQTDSLEKTNTDLIGELFPNCVTETVDEHGRERRAIDFDQLKQELAGGIVEGAKERYRLDWPGKRNAIVTANRPSQCTFRPIENRSESFETTKNLFIEGDNLEALKLLREAYLNKVQLVYVDPPYNTGNDFVYRDKFFIQAQDYLESSGQQDEEGMLVANKEVGGRRHSNWLSMLYPRLKIARSLMKDGAILVASIDDHELDNLIKIGSELFGRDNYLGLVPVINNMKGRNSMGFHSQIHEYMLAFQKGSFESYGLGMDDEKKLEFNQIENGERFKWDDLRKRGGEDLRTDREDMYFPLFVDPVTLKVSLNRTKSHLIEVLPLKGDGVDGRWRWGKKKVEEEIDSLAGRKNRQGEIRGINFRVYLNQAGVEKRVNPKSVWMGPEFSTDRATRTLNELIPGIVAKELAPKPVDQLARIIELSTKREDIVLDMFGGSGTTAHAVMHCNASDGEIRRCITIQIPETCRDGTGAAALGYETISQVCCERIRRAGAAVVKSSGISDLDVGFRFLRIDSSSMKDVYYSPDAVSQMELLDQVENIKEDREDKDLLFQVLVDWGVDLSLPIVEEDVKGKTVFFVDDNALAACFESEINEELVKGLAARKPLRAVFRDSGYGNDSVKINVEQIFKLISPGTEVKSI